MQLDVGVEHEFKSRVEVGGACVNWDDEALEHWAFSFVHFCALEAGVVGIGVMGTILSLYD